MPLNLPDKLPAIEILKKENIFVMEDLRSKTQDIRPLKILILNLMPIKHPYTKEYSNFSSYVVLQTILENKEFVLRWNDYYRCTC